MCVCLREREAEASFNPSGAGADARLLHSDGHYTVCEGRVRARRERAGGAVMALVLMHTAVK